jgi:hypothetical protein
MTTSSALDEGLPDEEMARLAVIAFLRAQPLDQAAQVKAPQYFLPAE